MNASKTIVVLVLLGTSVSFGTPIHGLAQEGGQEQTVEVIVKNDATSAQRIYVLQEGHMVPVGFVEAGENGTFTTPPVLVQKGEPIQLIADDLETTDWYKSDAVSVRPGNEVVLMIAKDLDRSTVSVRE